MMNGQSFREVAYQTPRKVEDVATPFWPGTDGHAMIADTPMDELAQLQKLAGSDPAAYSAALIIKCLIVKETGEPAFTDADRDWIKSQGSVILQLVPKINEFFGFDVKGAV